MTISESLIQSVRAVPANDVIENYVQLKKHGSEHRGLCPFHDERTPSFYVHPAKGFKCFGCDAKGDVIKFIMDYERKSFSDAVIHIAGMAGIALEQGKAAPVANCTRPKIKPLIKPEIDFIPFEAYQKILSEGTQSNYIKWLVNKDRGECAFDIDTIQTLIKTYRLGSCANEKYKGWVFFPCYDFEGRLTDIKAMDNNPANGKRIKEPEVRCRYIGKEILNDYNANLERSFYGEHLLKGNNKPIKIFEAESTATHAAPFYPESVCIATGGTHGRQWADKDKCSVLQGRHVTLYPDIDAHESWEQKAEILKGFGINIHVSRLIKNNALKYAASKRIDYSELVKQKYDLRDILKHKNVYEFLHTETFKAFENWISNNPEGGIFEYSEGRLIVKPRNVYKAIT